MKTHTKSQRYYSHLIFLSFPHIKFWKKRRSEISGEFSFVSTTLIYFESPPNLVSRNSRLHPEILPDKGLTKLPVRRNYVPRCRGSTVTACDTERKWLTNQNSIRLPVLTPVSAQAHPASPWSFHARPHNVSCSRHVSDQNQVEVTVTVDREPYPSSLSTWHPAVWDRDNAGTILSDLKEDRHG
jgi:hypothetical protein